MIGAEDATKGVDLALSPTINIDRSPLWGRSYETLGEDPYLTASLAVPLVQGIQANRVVSVVKHFAVYNQETNRGTPPDNSIVSDRALQEIYLPAFSAAIQAGQAGAIMCSYNLINGVPACQRLGPAQRASCATSGISTASSAPTAARCTTRRRPWRSACPRSSAPASTARQSLAAAVVRGLPGQGRSSTPWPGPCSPCCSSTT